jgi:Concanavalin A-like lectin/glucanases superfamily
MRFLKESFNAGEFTPRLWSRYELAKYKNACKTLTNFVPLAHGPVTRRPGFEYIAEVKDSSQNVRLIPFEFSEIDSYIIEFGNLYCRFYRNGGQIFTEDADTVLLLHCDGVNNSTTITDSGATVHSITAGGNAKLSTLEKKFGPSALIFGGASDYLTIPDHADLDFGSSEFTIDFWVNFSQFPSGSDNGVFYIQADDASHYQHFDIYEASAGNYNLRFIYDDGSGSNFIIRVWESPSLNTWYHIALIRGWGGNANDFAITVNGSIIGEKETLTDDLSDLSEDANIGHSLILTGLKAPIAYLDEYRISTTARWTANFPVPTAQYPFGDDSGTVYTLVTTYTQNILDQLYFVQSADTMYIVHENFVPKKLVRSDHASWAISDVSFTNAPDEWGVADYPRTIDFYEDRLVFGGNPNNPDSVYTSDSSDYAVFTESEDPVASESVQLTLGAQKINDILWVSGGRKLIIGTRGEEWWLSGPSDAEPLTPSDHVAKRDSAWGSERIRPINIGDAIFYVQRNGKILREMRYDFGSDRYISTDMSVLAEHLTKTYKITQIAYQQHPYQILWCLREDGVLLSLTYLKEHDVIGWAKHTSGSGLFQSIAVIPGDSEDELWTIIKREVDGSTVKYVERMKPFEWGSDLEDAFFVDSGLTYEGPAATEISGLDHLEGETLVGIADGIAVSDLIVDSGAITLDDAASKVHLGLSYTPEFETLDVVHEDKEGTLQGEVGRIANIIIFLVNSMGGKFGPDSSTTESIPYDDTTTPFTGWTNDLAFNEGSDKEKTVYITCDEPLPMEIAAINIDLEN